MRYNRTVADQKDRTWSKLPLIALTIALWVIFAPTKLGGRASYILVSGGSMEPNFHRGDLVITQKSKSYQVGEAVAYHDPLLDGVIYHRIVEDADGRYILQGDANDWLDNHEPTNEEILGKEWIYLPGFGSILETARQPAWLVTIAVVFVLMTVWPENPEQGLPEEDADDPSPRFKSGHFMADKQKHQEYFSLSLALAGLGLLGLIFFFTRPATQMVERFTTLNHQGEFSYIARSDEAVYETGQAVTGDPIFRNTSQFMTVSFDYQLVGRLPEDVTGEYQFWMELQDDSGWRRRVALIPATPFSGPSVEMEETVYFYDIQRLIDSFEGATLMERSAYRLTFIPEIDVILEGDSAPRVSTFAPELRFLLSPLEIRMIQSEDGNELSPFSEVVLSQQETDAAAFTFLTYSIPIKAARWVFGLLMVIAAASAGYLYWKEIQITSNGGYAARKFAHGSLIVDVSKMPAISEMAAVGSMEDLAALAERHRESIMHLEQDSLDYYFIKLPWDYYYFSEPAAGSLGLKEDEFN